MTIRPLITGAVALALAATLAGPAFAVPATPKGMHLKNVSKRTYFVPSNKIQKNVEARELSNSQVVKTETEKQILNSRQERLLDEKIVTTDTKDEQSIKLERRREGRLDKLIKKTHTETIAVTTTVQPYSVVQTTDYQTRTKTTAKNKYKARWTGSWTEGGKVHKATVETEEPETEETTYSGWTSGRNKEVVYQGRDVSTDRKKVKDSDEDKLVIATAATSANSGGAGTSSRGDIFSQSGKGLSGTSNASAQSSKRLAGAFEVAAKGESGGKGLDLTSLYQAAATSPDLYDDAGRKAFKLTLSGKTLSFIPYNEKGQIGGEAIVVDSDLKGQGAGGKIRILNYNLSGIGNLQLHGDFKEPLLGKGARTFTLNEN